MQAPMRPLRVFHGLLGLLLGIKSQLTTVVEPTIRRVRVAVDA